MAAIPNDPVMLLSYLNTQLRDQDASFSELCVRLDLNADAILQKLAMIDYHYDEERNQFL